MQNISHTIPSAASQTHSAASSVLSLLAAVKNAGMTSLGQLLQDVDLRQYNLQIPDKIIDEISDAVNYIRGYMGRE